MDNSNAYQRTCQYCGKEFKTNHGSRAFCPPPSAAEKAKGARDCKTLYNNHKAKRWRDQTKNETKPFAHNMKVLDSFYLSGKVIVTGEELSKKGFDLTKTTQIIKTDRSVIPIFYCFKLHNIGNDNFKIEKI